MKRLKCIGSVCILAFALGGALRAQDPSDLLEQAIDAETLRDQNLAIRLYTQIKDDKRSDPTTAAQALLRLGKCYLKVGRDKEAQVAFSELKKLFPDQKELIAGIPTDSILFRSAPWEDGEVLYYKETRGDIAGQLITGQFIMTAESSEENKERVWKLRQIYIINKSVITDVVDWMDSKYVPRKTKFKYQIERLEGSLKFAPDRIEIQKHGCETGILPRTQNVYYAGLMWLYRCLPLVGGYETDLSFLATSRISSYAITNLTFPVGTSPPPPEFLIANCHIKVADRKRIAVPAGTFDCFKIEITRTAAQLPTLQPPMVRMWIMAQSPFYIVQQEIYNKDSSISFLKLNSIYRTNRTQSDVIRDSGLDLSISTPAGWLVAASDEVDSKSLIFFDPECKSGGELQIDQQMGNNVPMETVALIVDQLIAELELIPPLFYSPSSKGVPFMNNYRVRKNSRVSLDIPGVAAATRFISEFQIQMNPTTGAQLQRPIDLIQYVYIYYFPMANRTYRLSLWTHPDNFEAMKPVFDKIANSLRMQ